MTASSAVVLGNLAYLIGAVVLATIGGLIVWLRHRQPRSVQAHVESFHRGLQALAPVTNPSGSNRGTRLEAPAGVRIQRDPDPADATDFTAATTPGEMVRRVHPVSADVDLAASVSIGTNGRGRHDAPDSEPEADGVVDRAAALGNGTVSPPAVSSHVGNGTVGPLPGGPDLAEPALPPLSSPATNGTVGPLPGGPDLAEPALPPLSRPATNGTVGPLPGGPDLAEPALPPLSPPATNGTVGPPPVEPDGLEPALPPLANGALGPLPASPPVGNGTVGPTPVSPDEPEPALPPLIDEAGSERRVTGRAGVEAG